MGKLRVDQVQDRDEGGGGQAMGPSLRSVMACFPTGVTVVATRDASGAPLGLTVNSFTSVSLDPPLVLVCIAHRSASHDPIIASQSFTVSVLSAAQGDIAQRFATSPSEGRFDGVDWRGAPSGHPVIEGAAAWLDCSIDEVIVAGDHSILLGRTVACGAGDQPALVFHRGEMGSTDG
ncbi:MAG: flavin reductase family protein [Gemmatimonadota bacterium]|nr:flavin reductase family protein [Gemmatimonadota bacterium]MDH3421496.1 flavin reductase family protein [Gemmatimonadota bacterium]